MNRFVSLLLVAFSLAAVSLARPAQAQWVKGLAYFGKGNTQTSTSGTTVTPTLNTNKASNGQVSVLSTEPATGTYTTSGSYSGTVGANYVWWGGSLTKAMSMQTTQSLEATGAGPGAANSYAGGGYGGASGSVSAGSNNGWDSKASPSFTYYFDAGVSPATQTQTVPLGASTSIYASGLGSTVVTAIVTFGAPIVTQ